MRAREIAVKRDRLLQQWNHPAALPDVAQPKRLGVLPQRRKRCRHLIGERRERPEVLERFSETMPELSTRAVHRVDQLRRVRRCLPHRGEDLTRLRSYQLDGERVAPGDVRHPSHHEGLHAFAEGQLARQGIIECQRGRPLQPLQCRGHLARREHAYVGRLGQVHPEGLGNRDGERSVPIGFNEVGDDEPIAGRDGAGVEQ